MKGRAAFFAQIAFDDAISQYVEGYGYPAYEYARDAIVCEMGRRSAMTHDEWGMKILSHISIVKGYEWGLFVLMMQTALSKEDLQNRVRFLQENTSHTYEPQYQAERFISFVRDTESFFEDHPDRAPFFMAFLKNGIVNGSYNLESELLAETMRNIALQQRELIPDYLNVIAEDENLFERTFTMFIRGLGDDARFDEMMLPILISNLESSTDRVQRMAAAHLGKILARSPQLREPILSAYYTVLTQEPDDMGEFSAAHEEVRATTVKRAGYAAFSGDVDAQEAYLAFWKNLLETAANKPLTDYQAYKTCTKLKDRFAQSETLYIREKVQSILTMLYEGLEGSSQEFIAGCNPKDYEANSDALFAKLMRDVDMEEYPIP